MFKDYDGADYIIRNKIKDHIKELPYPNGLVYSLYYGNRVKINFDYESNDNSALNEINASLSGKYGVAAISAGLKLSSEIKNSNVKIRSEIIGIGLSDKTKMDWDKLFNDKEYLKALSDIQQYIDNSSKVPVIARIYFPKKNVIKTFMPINIFEDFMSQLDDNIDYFLNLKEIDLKNARGQLSLPYNDSVEVQRQLLIMSNIIQAQKVSLDKYTNLYTDKSNRGKVDLSMISGALALDSLRDYYKTNIGANRIDYSQYSLVINFGNAAIGRDSRVLHFTFKHIDERKNYRLKIYAHLSPFPFSNTGKCTGGFQILDGNNQGLSGNPTWLIEDNGTFPTFGQNGFEINNVHVDSINHQVDIFFKERSDGNTTDCYDSQNYHCQNINLSGLTLMLIPN